MPGIQLRSKKFAVRRSPGFTIVELVVVIGIIVVLIAILLPALRVARETAQRSQCASQLRQVGSALHLYANANSGWLPAWSAWHTWPPGETGDTDGAAWTIELIPYIGNPDSPVYNCPSFPVRCRNYFLSAIWASTRGEHAMRFSDIKNSSRFVLSGDCTQPGVYPPPNGTADYLIDDADLSDEAVPLLCFPEQGGFLMHRGGNNVMFDDAHVETFVGFDRQRMSFDPAEPRSWEETRDLKDR